MLRRLVWRLCVGIACVVCAAGFVVILSMLTYYLSCERMSRAALLEFNERHNHDGSVQWQPDFFPILMTAYGHPEYLKETLAALEKVTDIESAVDGDSTD